jgi:hypothetical protein
LPHGHRHGARHQRQQNPDATAVRRGDDAFEIGERAVQPALVSRSGFSIMTNLTQFPNRLFKVHDFDPPSVKRCPIQRVFKLNATTPLPKGA